ncbi:MAG: hypothetical protein IJ779_11590, partial [Ruminococcus sp.]|nr:hypothetical protein [Ruminococcus sp.]
KFLKNICKPLTFHANSVIILMYSDDGTDCTRNVTERKRLVRAFTLRTGATPELLRENGAYFCVKDSEERDVSLLNLGGTTRAFVPFGGGGFFNS